MYIFAVFIAFEPVAMSEYIKIMHIKMQYYTQNRLKYSIFLLMLGDVDLIKTKVYNTSKLGKTNQSFYNISYVLDECGKIKCAGFSKTELDITN